MATLRVPKNKPQQPTLFSQLVDNTVARVKAIDQQYKSQVQQTINRAGEVAYDANQAIQNFFAPAYVDTYKERGFPIYMTDANRDEWGREANRADLGNFDPKSLPKNLPDIQGYRADPTGKFGGKEGIETRPTVFSLVRNSPDAQGSPSELYSAVRGLARSKKYGVPQLSAIELAALSLKEGKANFGALMPDMNQPKDARLFLTLLNKEKLPEGAARFAVLVKQKKDIAKSLGITFEEAWNGTGRSSWSGKTGKDYARDFPNHLKAARHPKNKQLVAFIQSALDAEKK